MPARCGTKSSGNLPTDFGFVIDVHAHEPETIYVVPIKSDSEHFPLDGKLRVYRSRTGGNEWEALGRGLPQEHCYVNVLRDAMAVDSLDSCGIYFGTTGGQVYVSPDGGDTWRAIVRDLPAVCPSKCRRCHDPRGAPVPSPHARRGGGGSAARAAGAGDPRRGPRRAGGGYPALRGTIRDHATQQRRPFIRFFACQEDWSHESAGAPLPGAIASGAEPLLIVGAMAGG